jgi:hypothetical protein
MTRSELNVHIQNLDDIEVIGRIFDSFESLSIKTDDVKVTFLMHRYNEELEGELLTTLRNSISNMIPERSGQWQTITT